MKNVFYTRLLSVGEMPVGIKIVYSYLAFESVLNAYGTYSTGGDFDYELIRGHEGSWVDFPGEKKVKKKICGDLGISRQMADYAIDYLKKHEIDGEKIIGEDGIFIMNDLFSNFFELQPEVRIRVKRDMGNGPADVWTPIYGRPLLVYSYLYSRCEKFGYIDTYRAKLAKTVGMNETALSRTIATLIDSGLVKKEMEGRHWKLYCVK